MHALELEWIQWIQQFRNSFLDFFFHFLRFFDRQEFVFALIPLVWINYGWKNGLRLFYILFLNTLVNVLLKDAFSLPRPFNLNPTLGLFSIKGYGFPSGAAQTTVLLSGLLIAYWKNSYKWKIVISYVLLVSFSRVYLGVHFPTDILGGWFFGFILLLGVLYVRPRLEKKLKSLTFYQLIALHLFVTLSISLAIPTFASVAYMGCSVGLAIGLWMCRQFKISLPALKGMHKYFLRAFVAIAGVFLFCMAFPLPVFFQTLLASTWLSFGAPWLLHKSETWS